VLLSDEAMRIIDDQFRLNWFLTVSKLKSKKQAV
jgi:hypothetical protein